MRAAVMRKFEQLMESDRNIVVITGDLGFSVLDGIKTRFPERFFNAGICEQAIMGIAAGLAKEGKKVMVYSIIPFLIYRPFEQILLDICYHRLPVILVGSAEGFAYGTEATSHYALNDLSLMLQIPGIRVYAPAEPEEAAGFVEEALNFGLPSYIRLAKGKDEKFRTRHERKDGLTPIAEGKQGVVLSTGSISLFAEQAVERLRKDEVDVGLVHVGRIKPLSEHALGYLKGASIAISIEEHEKTLGFGSYLSSVSERKIHIIGVEDPFTKNVGEREYMLRNEGLDSDGLYKKIKELLRR